MVAIVCSFCIFGMLMQKISGGKISQDEKKFSNFHSEMVIAGKVFEKEKPEN